MIKLDFQTDRERWIWLAGVIDGEGSLSITKKRDTRYKQGYQWCVTLTVSNNNRGFLDQVKGVCECGTVHDINQYVHRLKKYYKGGRFILTSTNPDKVKRILEKVLPFLIVKRERAENILSLNGSNWEACYQKVIVDRTAKGGRRVYHEIYAKEARPTELERPTLGAVDDES